LKKPLFYRLVAFVLYLSFSRVKAGGTVKIKHLSISLLGGKIA
jgi:hypothetical protein